MLRVRISSLPYIMSTLFSSHAKELYVRLNYFILSWICTSLLAYEFKDNILLWITHKIFSEEIEIITLSLPEALWNFVLISLWIGFIFSIPWLILNLYLYFRSGLYQFEADRWDFFIFWLSLLWLPFHYIQISFIWPKIAKWFLSFSMEYNNLSYLPTMNEFFSFLLNWSLFSSLFFFSILFMVFYIINTEKQAMLWYTNHRELYLLGSLVFSGLITPPDVVSQVLGGLVVLLTMEGLVIIDSIKQGYLPLSSSQGEMHS